ncbi:hypothetical protein CYMTET_16724 [Cymbomonas tetramitiformis]|uniref:CTLH domain-containing protein n=1 Tax=Cymbomonas tetramitiformis TaxID=36881 RepID=A0AAE0GBY1_9CHLO|nr:hypothetical protein CYMTET_16724 [Cymbomonas tetramitiformis]
MDDFSSSGVTGPPDDAVCQLVYSYLVHHCYKETAKALEASAGLSKISNNTESAEDQEAEGTTGNELGDIELRAPIYKHVLDGNVEQAIDLTNRMAEGLLSSRPDVYFELLSLQFAKLIREKNVLGAIKFAQEEFSSCDSMSSSDKETYLEKLQDLMSLIAYEEPAASPAGEFLTEEYRQRVADTLNGALLAFNKRPSQASLERVLQHTTLTTDRLAGSGICPRFNLRDFLNS